MARDNNDSGQPKFCSGHSSWFGNLTREPRKVNDNTTGLSVAANYRTYNGEEGVHFLDVLCFGGYAKAALQWDKGERLVVIGETFGGEYDGKTTVKVEASVVAQDHRFFGSSGGGGGSKRSSRDDDDDDRGSRRSRRGSDDDKGGSKRRSRDDDDKGSKKGKSSDDSGGTRRRRRSVADDDD